MPHLSPSYFLFCHQKKRSQKRILESSYRLIDLLKQSKSIMLLLAEFRKNAGLLKKKAFSKFLEILVYALLKIAKELAIPCKIGWVILPIRLGLTVSGFPKPKTYRSTRQLSLLEFWALFIHTVCWAIRKSRIEISPIPPMSGLR